MRYAHECALLTENRDEVYDANRHMLRSGLIVALLVATALSAISLFLPSFFHMRTAYLLVLLFTLVLLCLFSILPDEKSALVLLYILCCLFFAFGIWLSAGVSKDTIGSSIVGLFCLVPMMIVDRSRRINAFVLVVYVLYCVCVYVWKPIDVFRGDVVTSGCFVLAGLWISHSLRITKLENYDLRRLSAIQEETDFLTGLSNRRSLFRTIQTHEWLANAAPVNALLMIDIDWFKRFNDTNGHLEGDACLRTLGQMMLRFGAQNRIAFFRYGGEEFVGLCTVDGEAALVQLAESLRQAVEALEIPHDTSCFSKVTISIGCACMPDPPCTHERLIGMADAALYHAKETGRNRVVFYRASLLDTEPPVASCRQSARA